MAKRGGKTNEQSCSFPWATGLLAYTYHCPQELLPPCANEIESVACEPNDNKGDRQSVS